MRTTSCTLSEVTNVDGEGKPVLEQSSSADTFSAAMEKYVFKTLLLENVKLNVCHIWMKTHK